MPQQAAQRQRERVQWMSERCSKKRADRGQNFGARFEVAKDIAANTSPLVSEPETTQAVPRRPPRPCRRGDVRGLASASPATAATACGVAAAPAELPNLIIVVG